MGFYAAADDAPRTKNRPTRAEVTTRREQVFIRTEAGESRAQIAAALNVPEHAVENDQRWIARRKAAVLAARRA